MRALGVNWHLINVPSFLFRNGTYLSADNPNIIITYKIIVEVFLRVNASMSYTEKFLNF